VRISWQPVHSNSVLLHDTVRITMYNTLLVITVVAIRKCVRISLTTNFLKQTDVGPYGFFMLYGKPLLCVT